MASSEQRRPLVTYYIRYIYILLAFVTAALTVRLLRSMPEFLFVIPRLDSNSNAAGKTSYERGEHKCKACGESKGRSCFNGRDLSNQKQKVNAKAPYTLVCLACKTREEELVSKLEQLDARTCRKCFAGCRWHKPTCTAKFTVRFAEGNLEFLTFRSTHKTVYRSSDTEYYKRLGVLS